MTHVAPAADAVVDVIASQRQVDDALVNGLAAALGRQVLLGDGHPPQRAHRELDGRRRLVLGRLLVTLSTGLPEWRDVMYSLAYDISFHRLGSTTRVT